MLTDSWVFGLETFELQSAVAHRAPVERRRQCAYHWSEDRDACSVDLDARLPDSIERQTRHICRRPPNELRRCWHSGVDRGLTERRRDPPGIENVDAIDEDAVAYYERYGFVSAPEHDRRLYRRMKDVRSSLGNASDA